MTIKPSVAIQKLYQKYYRLGRPLAGERTHAETAFEFTNKLIRKLDNIYIDSGNHDVVAYINSSLARFTNIYHLSLFSNHKINQADIRTEFQLWKRLRRYLILSRLRNLLQRINHGIRNKVKRFSLKST